MEHAMVFAEVFFSVCWRSQEFTSPPWGLTWVKLWLWGALWLSPEQTRAFPRSVWRKPAADPHQLSDRGGLAGRPQLKKKTKLTVDSSTPASLWRWTRPQYARVCFCRGVFNHSVKSRFLVNLIVNWQGICKKWKIYKCRITVTLFSGLSAFHSASFSVYKDVLLTPLALLLFIPCSDISTCCCRLLISQGGTAGARESQKL